MKNFIAIVALIAVVGGGSYVTRNLGYVETTVTLTRDAERVCRGSGDSRSCGYEVYTDKGVFANKDSIMHGKFNSGDLQANFIQDATCKVTAVGFRVPFLSMRKNILTAECSSQ